MTNRNILLEKEFKEQFLQKLKESVYESGCLSIADEYLSQCIDSVGRRQCYRWLHEFYLDNCNNEYLMVQLLWALAHLSYDEEMGGLLAIVFDLAKRKSAAIVEQAVRAIENWEYIPAISFLKKLHCDEGWLNNYIKEVIRELSNS
jgi:hypothetical protein